jgi:FeS assembly SUF system protein
MNDSAIDTAKRPPLPVEEDLVAALKTVHDPEIPVNIYELGLIYRCEIMEDGSVEIDMTLTAPGCPVAGEMPGWVEAAVAGVENVRDVQVDIVWDPPWHPGMMTDAAKLELGML